MATADLGIRVFLDDSAKAGLGSLSGSLLGLGGVVGGLGSQFSSLSGGMQAAAIIAAGSGITFGAFASAIRWTTTQAQDLQNAITGMMINIQGAGPLASELTAEILKLGSTSIYSSQQLADGFSALGQKGFDAAQILGNNGELGQAMVWLAEAMGEQDGVTGAATLLSSALKLFGADASQATNYANMLDYAFHNGIPSIAGMQQALNQVGPSAVAAGYSFQQIGPVMITLAQDWNNASTAGVSLRNILNGLMNPTAQAQKGLQNLGIITVNQTSPAITKLRDDITGTSRANTNLAGSFNGTITQLQAIYNAANKLGVQGLGNDFYTWALKNHVLSNSLYDANGNLKDFNTILQIFHTQLTQAAGGNQQMQRELGQIFNQTALKGMEALNTHFSQTEQHLSAVGHGLANFGGAQRDAATITSTTTARIAALTTTWRDLGALLGGPINNTIGQIAGQLLGLLGPLVQWLQKNPQVAQMASTFLLVGGAISGVVFAVSSLIFIFGTIGSILLPVGAVVLALGGIITIVTLIIQNWQNLEFWVLGILQRFRAYINLGIAAVGALAIALLNELVPDLIIMGVQLVRASIALGVSFVQAAYSAIPAIFAYIAANGGLIPTLFTLASAAWSAAAGFIALNWPILLTIAVIAGVGIAIYLTLNHFKGWQSELQAIWKFLSGTFGPIIQDTIATVVNSFKSMISNLQSQLRPAWTQMVAAFQQAMPVLHDLGMILAVVGGIFAAVVVGVIIGALRGFINWLLLFITGIANIFSGLITALMGAVTFISGLLTFLHGLFTLNGKEIQAGFKTMLGGIATIFSGLRTAIAGVFIATFGAAIGFVVGFVQGIIQWFQHLADVLVHHSIIPDMLKAILKWFVSIPEQILAAITTWVVNIISFFLHLAGMSTGQIQVMWARIHVLVQIGLAAVQVLIQTVFGFIQAIFSGNFSKAGQIFQNGMAVLGHLVLIGLNLINQLFGGLPGRILSILTGLGSTLLNAGGNLMHMLASGITNGISLVENAVGGAANKIKQFLGFHSPPKGGPLADSDQYMPNMMKMYASGIAGNTHLLQTAVGKTALALHPSNLATPSLAGVGGAGTPASAHAGTGVVHNHFEIDSKEIATAVYNVMTGQMKMNGIGRAFR